MRIRFEVTEKDIIAFNRYHCENSPAWRAQRNLATWLFPAAVILLIAFVALAAPEPLDPVGAPVAAALAIGVAIAIGFFLRWRVTVSVVTMTRKLLAEGSNRNVLGWYEMELVNHRLVVTLELIQTRMDVRAVEKIVGDDAYTFVYFGSMHAYPIPMNLYPEEEYRQFVADLKQAWEARDEPREMPEGSTDVHVAHR